MKLLFLISLLQFLSSIIYCQTDTINISDWFIPSSGHDGYILSKYPFNYGVFSRTYSDKELGKIIKVYQRNNYACHKYNIVQEYYQSNDSCFAYTSYDSAENANAKGLLCINRNRFDSFPVSFPDMERDPTLEMGLMKDSMLCCTNVYEKQGYWEEGISKYKKWEGNYNYGIKTGVWRRCAAQPCHYSGTMTDSVIIYEDGKVVNNDYSHLSEDSIFLLLKGKWHMEWLKRGRYFQLYTRDDSAWYEPFDHHFISQNKFTMLNDKNVRVEINWKFQQNCLLFFYGEQPTKYKILPLNHEQLILERLKDW